MAWAALSSPEGSHCPSMSMNDHLWAQGGDDDVDALLAQFALEEKAKNTADIREGVPAPSARVYASFVPDPTSVSHI